jgi:hypothetical protein
MMPDVAALTGLTAVCGWCAQQPRRRHLETAPDSAPGLDFAAEIGTAQQTSARRRPRDPRGETYGGKQPWVPGTGTADHKHQSRAATIRSEPGRFPCPYLRIGTCTLAAKNTSWFGAL